MLVFEGYTADQQILEPVDLGYGLLNIGNGEYIPEGTDLSVLDKTMRYDETAVQISGIENRYLTWKADVSNQGDEEQAVSFPMLYYDGYQCRDLASKMLLETYAGENNRVTITVPGGYSGIVQVRFEEHWYWKVAEGISLITFIVIICRLAKDLCKRKKWGRRNDWQGRMSEE